MKTLLTFVILSVISLDPPPLAVINMPSGTPEVIYWSGMWEPQQPWGQFKLGTWHKDSFIISWTVYNSEPEIGYPYHYGTVQGINDTTKVRVYFDNRTEDDYYIGSESPEDWFYPVLYTPSADVFSTSPLADTSVFEYRFEHWINMMDDVIADKPDTIRSRALHKPVYPWGMILSIWDVDPGNYRVVLLPTSSKPTDVKLILDNPNNKFTVIRAQNVLDSINAYCAVAVNALLRREFTLFNSFVDSVFYMNSQSMPGWALKYSGYEASADTADAIAAIDSILHIGNNNLDPFVPDSSKRTKYNNRWLEDYLHNYPFAKWRLLYPEESKYIIFW